MNEAICTFLNSCPQDEDRLTPSILPAHFIFHYTVYRFQKYIGHLLLNFKLLVLLTLLTFLWLIYCYPVINASIFCVLHMVVNIISTNYYCYFFTGGINCVIHYCVIDIMFLIIRFYIVYNCTLS